MRFALLLALAASALSASAARAQEWCGYPDKSVIQCGFSSVATCQQSVGKDGFCFADPAES
jgi:hypothetical protein